ncbi:MAG: dTMP kinase [Candidatus Kapabacteria bacterium]|nr:dTMP kinase [Ignavibacteriota bacterium]MCW5883473.1 dTMP kinase [Candidatus Kapabacteria bacterium]
MLITFEGIDGCGKTTQLKLVAEMLESRGFKVHSLREPGGTDVSEAIREILLSSKSKLNDITELLLFESARSNLVESIIKPALAKGDYVLCDRFFDSTTAYQGYGRQIDLNVIQNCNEIATGGLKPNLTFYLRLSLQESKKRAGSREKDRIEKAGDNFFLRVIKGFDEIAANEPERVKIIDASGGIDETKIEIFKHISI